LPSRTLSFRGRAAAAAGGAGLEPGVDDVAELALERAERFLAGLALGDLAVEVGTAGAVGVPDLGDRGHVNGVAVPPVAAQGEPVDLPAAGGDLDGGGAVVGGEAVPAGEPGHLTDGAEDGGGDDRAGAEDAGQGGARGGDRRGELGAGVAPLGVQAAQIGEEFGGEPAAGGGGRAGRADAPQPGPR